MEKKYALNFKTVFLSALLIMGLLVGGAILLRESSRALGGNFGAQMVQQGGRYQISAGNANFAWVIDTAMGDVYMIYSNGKWKDVGSILDETKRIKK